MHIGIFKIIETCYYWLHIIQLHDAPFHFLIKGTLMQISLYIQIPIKVIP